MLENKKKKNHGTKKKKNMQGIVKKSKAKNDTDAFIILYQDVSSILYCLQEDTALWIIKLYKAPGLSFGNLYSIWFNKSDRK